MRRSAGLLLHITSLPGPSGVGDLGPCAHEFVDFLADAGVGWWQTLPVAPPGAGDSPYKAVSAFAGNPLMISLEGLVEEGLLSKGDLPTRAFPEGRANFEDAAGCKEPLFRTAFQRWRPDARFERFQRDQAFWLGDFARFMALREQSGRAPWNSWPDDVQPDAAGVAYHEFLQFQFHRQWSGLRRHCARRGVQLMGDLPIFVAHDSADVWARRDLFFLDRRGRPTLVAGVPPDYFSETGQLWGNPLYDWSVLRSRGYSWWLDRMRASFALFDAVRLDHFIGFHNYWEIPAGAEDARAGCWRPGPGDDFFRAVFGALPGAQLIAEDLGVLTPAVAALRDRWKLPGIRVLQFSFGADAETRPWTYPRNSVAYTGTHDNNTVAGWLEEGGAEPEAALRYAPFREEEPTWAMIRLAWMSPSDLVVVPAQDLLGLGSEARMNVPGTPKGNWSWRLRNGTLTPAIAARLRELSQTYSRENPLPA